MNTATLILTSTVCILTLILPKKSILLPFLIVACMIPMNQRLIIFSLDFTSLRLVLLCAMARMFISGENRKIEWNDFDKLILKWNIVGSAIYCLQNLTFSSLIYKAGVMYDSLGIYWIFRQNIQSFDDIYNIIKSFALLAIASAPLTAAEKIRQSSFYAIFGNVNAQFHRGRYRCSGPFPHSIMMGIFWASLFPFFYSRIKDGADKLLYWLAAASAITCIYFSASSTPALTLLALISFWYIFHFRHNGKTIFIACCLILLVLHLIMNAPVWHLMARIDVYGGSTGWHRYKLFNEFINHTSEWFFLGTRSTAHWGRGLEDITNQYVIEAIRGGFLTLLLFVTILYNAIKITGRYSLLEQDIGKKYLSWAVCVSLLGHVISFLGVSYFGQILLILYATFAIVGFIQQESIKKYETQQSIRKVKKGH